MPLAVYDATGRITQAFLMASDGLEMVSERYKEQGISHVLTDEPVDIMNCYVKNEKVIPRPFIAITGDEVRPIKADGADTLTFHVGAASVHVQVWFNSMLVHEEIVTDGTIEFAADQAGTYRISIGAEFPYLGADIIVEAV